jgi:O-antigen ligase
VSRQWQDFLRPTTGVEQGSARLTTAKGTRSDLYRVAFDGFEEHPLRGDGAGGFTVRWMQHRRVYEAVRDAHSLELETLGELGAVGGLILLAFLATLVWAAVRSRIRRAALPRAHAAAVGAACSVWVAHSAVDWDWQMPALTGCVLVLAATLYPVGTMRRRRRASGGATGVAALDG